jgi:hypothetical protein
MKAEFGDGLRPGDTLWPGHPEGLGFLGLKMRYVKFEHLRLWCLFMLWLLKPRGLVSHEHLTVLYLGSMGTQIPAPLHPDPGPILTVIQPCP